MEIKNAKIHDVNEQEAFASNEEVDDLLTNCEMVEIKGGLTTLAMDCNRCTVTCVRKAKNNNPVS